MNDNRDDQHISASYRKLRRTVGLLGVSLPFVLLFCSLVCSGCKLLPTISDYYYSNMVDIFVGILFTIGWFLFAYEGYETRDNIAGNFACFFALGVALFPTQGTGIVMLQIKLDFCGGLISYKLGSVKGGVHVEEA